MTDIDRNVDRLRRIDCCAVSDALDKLGLTGCVTGIPQRSTARRIEALEVELAAERARTDALVASLPKCRYHPDRTATRSEDIDHFCDECGTKGKYPISEDDLAGPLRAILTARANSR